MFSIWIVKVFKFLKIDNQIFSLYNHEIKGVPCRLCRYFKPRVFYKIINSLPSFCLGCKFGDSIIANNLTIFLVISSPYFSFNIYNFRVPIHLVMLLYLNCAPTVCNIFSVCVSKSLQILYIKCIENIFNYSIIKINNST